MKTRVFCSALMLLATISLSLNAKAQSETVSSTFLVDGDVTHPHTFDLDDLERLPTTNQNVTYFTAGNVTTQSFTGALLWDLLQSVGIKLDPNIKNDILRKIVIVTGNDGYETVFGAGEIAPDFGGDQIMVAYKANGQLLGQNGFARIVVPGDKKGSRFVSNIVTIEVRNIGN
jgi:DMSO/TMAO reductase YedYZ molybdopterin-dependent catalytic subunit